jgi:hypothetical protein
MMSNLSAVGRRILRFALRPQSAMDAVANQPLPREGVMAVSFVPFVWSMFCLLLFAGGHAPSFALVPVPRESYYLAQAVFVFPVTLGLWWLMGVVVTRIVGGPSHSEVVFSLVGYAYAAPMLFAFLLVDVVIYGVSGFEALGRYIRFYAPVAPLWSLALATVGLRRAVGATWGRALLASMAALAVQAIVGGLVLR